MNKLALLLSACLITASVSAQKLSIPEMVKLDDLASTSVSSFLVAKNYHLAGTINKNNYSVITYSTNKDHADKSEYTVVQSSLTGNKWLTYSTTKEWKYVDVAQQLKTLGYQLTETDDLENLLYVYKKDNVRLNLFYKKVSGTASPYRIIYKVEVYHDKS